MGGFSSLIVLQGLGLIAISRVAVLMLFGLRAVGDQAQHKLGGRLN